MLGTGDFTYNVTYSPLEQREYLAEILLKDSENMSSFCIFCGKIRPSDRIVSHCGKCKRFWCNKCIKTNKSGKKEVLCRLCTEFIKNKVKSQKKKK